MRADLRRGRRRGRSGRPHRHGTGPTRRRTNSASSRTRRVMTETSPRAARSKRWMASNSPREVLDVELPRPWHRSAAGHPRAPDIPPQPPGPARAGLRRRRAVPHPWGADRCPCAQSLRMTCSRAGPTSRGTWPVSSRWVQAASTTARTASRESGSPAVSVTSPSPSAIAIAERQAARHCRRRAPPADAPIAAEPQVRRHKCGRCSGGSRTTSSRSLIPVRTCSASMPQFRAPTMSVSMRSPTMSGRVAPVRRSASSNKACSGLPATATGSAPVARRTVSTNEPLPGAVPRSEGNVWSGCSRTTSSRPGWHSWPRPGSASRRPGWKPCTTATGSSSADAHSAVPRTPAEPSGPGPPTTRTALPGGTDSATIRAMASPAVTTSAAPTPTPKTGICSATSTAVREALFVR